MFWKLPLTSEAQTDAESLIKASPNGSNGTDKQNTPMYSNVYKTALKSDMGLQNLSVLCVSLIMGLGDDSGKDDKDNDNEISSNQSFTVMGPS